MRHRANRFDVLRDIVADKTVATRRGILQPAFFVHHRHRNAIHFGLNDDWDFFVRQKARDSFVKIHHLFFGIGVVEAEHRRAVLDLRKRLERFSADALSWRIGREEIRKLRFEINKLLVEPVVLAIADDRRGVLVIQPVVLADFFSQLRDVFLGFGSVHRC